MALGDVIFTPRLDTKKFNRDLGRLKQDGERLGLGFAKNFDKGARKVKLGSLFSDIKLFKKGIKATNDELQKSITTAIEAKDAYKKAVKQYEDFAKGANSRKNADLFNLGNRKKELEEQLSFKKQLEGYGDTSGVAESAESIKAQIAEITAKMEELKNTGWSEEDIAKARQYEQAIREAGNAMLTADKIADGLARGANFKGSKILTLIDFIKTKLKGLLSVPLKIAKGMLGGIIGGFKGLFRIITSGVSRIIALVGVVALLRQGLSNLIKADKATANSINQMKASFTNLGNAMASAVAPLIQTLAPAISKIIDLFAKGANAVAMFFSALTGKKVSVVSSGVSGIADGIGGIGDSADGANSSAKELQRTLMGFDKINKLDGSSGGGSGGGGGGGSGGGGGGGFTTMPVTEDAFAWADKFKESWEKGDFYWLGELLANKINDALEKIPWDKINATLEKVAKSIGTFLNGFIENLDWGLLGKTIGEGIKAGLNFLNTFLETVNWEAIGKAIVDFITGIDWIGIFTGAGRLLGNIASAILGVLKGAVDEASKKLKKWLEDNDVFDFITDLQDKSVAITAKFFADWGVPDWVKKLVEFSVKSAPIMTEFKLVAILTDLFKKIYEWLSGNKEHNIVAKFGFSVTEGAKNLWDWITGKKTFSEAVLGKEKPTVSIGIGKSSGWKGFSVTGYMKSKWWGKTKTTQSIGIQKTKGWTGFSITSYIKKKWWGSTKTTQSIGIQKSKGWTGFSITSYLKKKWWGSTKTTQSISIQKSKGWTGFSITSFIKKKWWGSTKTTQSIGIQKSKGWTGFSVTGYLKNKWWGKTKTIQSIGLQKAKAWSGKSISAYVKEKWLGKGVTISVGAKFTTWKDALKNKVIGFQAKMTSWKDALKNKVIGFTAKMVSWYDALRNKVISFTAKISSWYDALSKKVISFTAKITSWFKKTGGVYKNGKWSPIQQYASGGSPNGGQMFIAREKGPELVGTLGGHTAVMNNDQIVASVSDGVAKAIAGIRFKMTAPPLAMTSRSVSSSATNNSSDSQMVILLTQILKAINSQETNVYLDGEQIKNNVVKRINNHTKATGRLELIV